MQLATFQYTTAGGFSAPLQPDLDSPATLVVVFGSLDMATDSGPLEALAHAYPSSQIVGCSTAGEILGTKLFDSSLSVAVAKFERTEIAVARAAVSETRDSFQAGSSIATALARPDLEAVFVLSDGLRVNGSELVRGFRSCLSPGVMVTGGLAGDGDRFLQLMRANFDRLIDGAGEAGRHGGLGHDQGQPTLAIAVSCVGRRLVLGERTEEEIEATLHALPPSTQQIGFY